MFRPIHRADSPASDVTDVLTNQSADTQAQGYIGHSAHFALISAHYWQLFKSFIITAAVLHMYRISHSNTGQKHKHCRYELLDIDANVHF